MTYMILIDNYDSFTYNLMHSFAPYNVTIDVIRNDEKTVEEIIECKPDAIIISPGPCTPNETGICLPLMKEISDRNIPTFGVCLGHQVIGQYFGGKIIRAPQPMHGKLSPVQHTGQGIFCDIPDMDVVTRYHSLIIDRDTLPEELTITAQTQDGLIMGVQHKSKPIHGIQFHPESIATQNGDIMIRNFIHSLQNTD